MPKKKKCAVEDNIAFLPVMNLPVGSDKLRLYALVDYGNGNPQIAKRAQAIIEDGLQATEILAKLRGV